MSISPVERTNINENIRPPSIHLLSLSKICRFFTVEEAKSELRDLIDKVIDLYNRTFKKEGENVYEQIEDIEQPKWPVRTFEPFTMSIYAQVIPNKSRISLWLEKLGTKKDLHSRKVQYIFFLFREREIEKKTIKEIFALTTGQAWRVIQKFSDFRFPINIAKRLMKPQIYQSKKRPIVGSVLLSSEILKQNTEVLQSEAVDKFYTNAKFAFREDSSIFKLRYFQNVKGKPLKRGMSADIGLGLVRLSKELKPESYSDILDLFSKIACHEKTFCSNEDETEEKDSDGFEFLEHFQPVDFTLIPQLDKALAQAVSDYIYQDIRFPLFDFCHKHREEFFRSDCFILSYEKVKIGEWDLPPSAQVVIDLLKALLQEKKVKKEDFLQELKECTFGFRREGKMETTLLTNYLEGELRIRTGKVYWRLHTMWYEIHADFLGLIHQEFCNMLEDCLISSAKLPHLWPSPKMRKERKIALGNKRYDVEGEYNQTFIGKKGFFFGDKICPQGIELGDIFHVDENFLHIFQVKEGFGHQTRDACSQILNAAKLLYYHTDKMKTPTQVVEEFYEIATKGGKEPRDHIKKEMLKISKQEFVEYFSKKIIFVYAFADKAQGERLLAKENKMRLSITSADIEAAHKKFKGQGAKIYQALTGEEYITKHGRLTSKFISAAKDSFSFNTIPVKKQRDALFDCLRNFQTQFDSTIAKLELISLKEELRKHGYEFKILQISRHDYKNLPEDTSEITSPRSSPRKKPRFSPDHKNTQENIPESPSFRKEPRHSMDDEFFDFGYSELDELPGLDSNEWEEIRDELGKGKTFTIDDEKYFIAPTLGDMACGLHALLGEKNKEGEYAYQGDNPNADARAAFTQHLKKKITTPSIQQLWQSWMTNFLKDYLSPSPSAGMIYAKMVFDPTGSLLMKLKENLSKLEEDKKKSQKNQETLFSQATDEKDFHEGLKKILGYSVEELKTNSKLMNNKFRENLDTIRLAFNGTKIGTSMAEISQQLKDIEQRRDQLFLEYICKPGVFIAYLKGVSLAGYYFSNQEIGLAAHLFQKRVVIYGHKHLNEVEKTVEEGDTTHPKVVIFHKGDHFSRCEVSPKTGRL